MSHILVMGVCGVGKSTIARKLAEAHAFRFVEADDYHSISNIVQMKSGRPLTDQERFSWLDRIGEAAKSCSGNAVIACSALKAIYRDILEAHLGPLRIVHLVGSRELLRERVSNRSDHFMPASLVDSQLADLEAPSGNHVTDIDIALPIEDIVQKASQFISNFEFSNI